MNIGVKFMISEPIFDNIIIGSRDGLHHKLYGIGILILYDNYDKDQLWFSFMNGTVFKNCISNNKPKSTKSFKNLPYARMPDKCKRLYLHVENQFNLRFHENRKISNKEFKEIKQAGYMGWDRNNNKLLFLNYEKCNIVTVNEWCNDNCIGRYKIESNGIYFQKQEDYICICHNACILIGD